MTAQAVLFDMDGLLVDSEPTWYEVESELVAQLGGVWSKEHQERCIGGMIEDGCRYMLELTDSDLPVQTLVTMLLDAIGSRFRASLPLFDGAVDLVDAVRAREVGTGLVSSSYRVLVDAALGWLGPERFDVSVSGDEVVRGKPHPEPYLTACRRLGVEPARTVVIEDSPSGIRSAEAAGCIVVAVPTVTAIEPASRRHVRSSLLEIDADWLVRLPSLARDGAEHVES